MEPVTLTGFFIYILRLFEFANECNLKRSV